MRERIVYIARGDMGIILNGAASPLPGQRLLQYERIVRSQEERHAWKTEGAGAMFMGRHNPYAGLSEENGRVSSASYMGGRLYYAAITGESGGIFVKDPNDPGGQEGLRYSGASFFIEDMDARDGAIAISLMQPRGECHIRASATCSSKGISLRPSGICGRTSGAAIKIPASCPETGGSCA